MIFITVATGGVLTYLLYETAFEEQRGRLIEAAQSQARLIEAVARFNASSGNYKDLQEAAVATRSQIIDAHSHYKGFGETGEFTLAKKEGDQIVFLLSHRHHDMNDLKPVPFDSEIAGPMRQALCGLSGTIVGYDYRGVKVLGAHEPVEILNFGIVAKIDLDEIRRPFIRAGLIGGSVGMVLIAIGAFLFRFISEPIIDDLHKSHKQLEEFNYNLEKKVQEEIGKNKEKDRLMVQQSRYAQMGELLSMIAHQWRQPLNAISMAAIEISLSDSGDENELKLKREMTKFIEKQTQYMSEIINDFMNYFKPEKDRVLFGFKDVFDDILMLIGPQLKSRGMKIEFLYDESVVFLGFKKELEQIIINVVSNSRDAYIDQKITNGIITIQVEDHPDHVRLSIADQAGGIDPDIIDRIFDPYFTTKEKGTGTGIGLYMSKEIIERSFNGAINVENIENGTRFCISLPKTEKASFA